MPEFWQTLSPSIIGLLAAGCFAAYFLKGFSGFGPALILIPTLTLIFGPSFALAGSAFVDLAIALRMVAAIAAGTLPGALLAGKAPRAVVLLAIGVSVVAMGLRWIISRSSSPGAGGSVPAAGRRIWAGCALGGFTGGIADR